MILKTNSDYFPNIFKVGLCNRDLFYMIKALHYLFHLRCVTMQVSAAISVITEIRPLPKDDSVPDREI
jgi:hypothetical protein